MSNSTAANDSTAGVDLSIDKESYSTRVQSFDVKRDLGRADVATIELSGLAPKFSPGAPVTLSMYKKAIFLGEIVDISTTYGTSGQQQTTKLIAMNQLHRLDRGRRSHKPFPDKDDEQIIGEIAKEYGMTKVVWGDKNLTFKHPVVLWTNQTAMEFLSQRALRYGYHIWCVDKTLYCKAPDLSKKAETELTLGKNLASFLPRMSSARITKTVHVQSTNPTTAKVIEGISEAKGKPPLGSVHATKACGDDIAKENLIVDIPVLSKAEADAVADAQFLRQSLTFITAEAELVGGNPEFELGTTVDITLSRGDQFNGGYYITGIAHRFVPKRQTGSHFVTHLSLARDARS